MILIVGQHIYGVSQSIGAGLKENALPTVQPIYNMHMQA